MEAVIRRQILEAAGALIGELGWGQVTTRKVAERAGVNNALIHYYFGSKDALLREAARTLFTEEFEGPLTALVAAEGILAGIDGFFAALDSIESGPAARTGVEVVMQGLRDPEISAWFAEMLEASRMALAEVIARQQADGEVPAHLDPDGTAMVVIGALDSFVLYRLVHPDIDLTAARTAFHEMLSPTERNEE